MPDLDLVTSEGTSRVFALLRRARPLLLNFGEANRFDVAAWTDRVQLIDAKCAATCELPVIGAVAVPDAVLIRPDGYVAWVGEGAQAGLTDALTRWFGSPRP
jgi:3-(3-hydroxy-phenyl)propionate hydroxylase